MFTPPPIFNRRKSESRAFTLVELLVSMSILSLIFIMLLSVITNTTNLWISSSAKVEAFQSARMAFDAMTRSLSQATLNTYIDYDYDANGNPSRYLLQSELRFVTGSTGTNGFPGTPNTGQAFFFVAPASYTLKTAQYGGMESLLNVCGYYISFSQNNAIPGHANTDLAKQTYRYRLMQSIIPTEQNTGVYTSASTSWFTSSVDYSHPVADNIIALIIRPQDPSVVAPASPDLSSDGTDTYNYDTTLNAKANSPPPTANQLPPVLQVTMVAIDEASAKRIANGSAQPPVIVNMLAGIFSQPSNFDADLDALEGSLRKAKIQYRVFSSTIAVREAKWTK